MTKKTRAKARRALLTLSLVLVVAFAAVGGTIAWLTDETNAVVNTFGNTSISIDLKEHAYNPEGVNENKAVIGTLGSELVTEEDAYKMIPGVTLPKDPFIYVDETTSEDVYVAVGITKSAEAKDDDGNYTQLAFDSYLSYEINTANWESLGSKDGTDYYIYKTRLTTANTATINPAYILKNNQVTVLDNADMTVVTETNQPKLTFKAYAVQANYINAAKDTNTSYTDAITIFKTNLGLN